jgi:hypothetical protein
MELDDDLTDMSTIDLGLEGIESDDESLVGYLTLENSKMIKAMIKKYSRTNLIYIIKI